jgi:hypothetical protein
MGGRNWAPCWLPWKPGRKKGGAGHGAEASLGENADLLKPGQRHGAPKKNQEGGSSWGGTLLPSAMDLQEMKGLLPCARVGACSRKERRRHGQGGSSLRAAAWEKMCVLIS